VTAPLPPLPSVRGVAWYEPAGRSIVDLLVAEHHDLRLLCAELTDLAGPPVRRSRIADVLTATLTRHISGEEQYLYPAVRAVLPDGDRLAEQEIAADVALLRALTRLTAARPEDDGYEGLVHRVCTQVARHVDEASRTLLPRLRVRCREEDLVRLGNRLEIAEEAAPTRPHLSTPVRPPWNKLVDPGIGVFDKIRDALTGRATYPADVGL